MAFPSAGSAIAAAWERCWFAPALPRPLAIVRILAGTVALALWWSWSADLNTWFGPDGLLPVEAVREWRSPWGVSILDLARSTVVVRGLYLAIGAALVCLTVGLATPLAAPLAAAGFASLLHRAPMLAGPADDCTAVLLWCLVVGRSGDDLSVDRQLAVARGSGPAQPGIRNRIALSLLLVHAAVIAGAALLAQLKADVWWGGSAAWLLSINAAVPVQFQTAFGRSEYLTDAVTHGITLFEAVFAAGVCVPALRRLTGWIGIVGWPVVGLVVGEPWWGAAMAVFAVTVLLTAPVDGDRAG
ncbi:MAG: hypothetical protein FJ309_05325 [Planctomycetes bacterium]|nr:hypothetical protein [Planctomycetota bacterium]